MCSLAFNYRVQAMGFFHIKPTPSKAFSPKAGFKRHLAVSNRLQRRSKGLNPHEVSVSLKFIVSRMPVCRQTNHRPSQVTFGFGYTGKTKVALLETQTHYIQPLPPRILHWESWELGDLGTGARSPVMPGSLSLLYGVIIDRPTTPPKIGLCNSIRS